MKYPRGWIRTRLKYVADCNVRTLAEDTDPEFTFSYVDISSVSQGRIATDLETYSFARAPSRARRIARSGSTVVSTVRTYLRAVATAPECANELVFSTGFAVIDGRTNLIDDRFLAYFAQSDALVDRVSASSVGVSYPAINASDIMAFDLWIPTLDTQRAIADFLDRETAKIDALIEKQNELIGLLRERRTALVIRATSRGIGEQQLRPSSMYWAPLIPQGWCEQPLKHVLENIQSGVWGEDEDGGVNDIPCVRVADFDRPRLRVGNPATIRKVSRADRMKCRLLPGDLLIEKSGGTGINPVGFVVTYDGDATAVFANFIARLRIKEAHNSRYWLYALYGSYAGGLTWRSVKQTTGIQNLDTSSLLAEAFPVPDRQSQDDVVEHLDRETARIDALIAKAEEFIALARERRAALITAAVTGQIDVLGEAG